jgi:hypothetical protein
MTIKSILNNFLRRGGDLNHPHAWIREQTLSNCLMDAQNATAPNQQQIQQIEHLSAELIQQIFIELRATRFDFSVPEEPFDIDELELRTVQLLQEWAETKVDSQIASEVVFLDLFLRRLVAEFAANNRFWELLLLKLDRALAESNPLGHVLSNCIEILLAAVPRFAFVRYFLNHIWSIYQRLNTTAPAWLPIILVLNARPDAAMWPILLRSLNQYQLWEDSQEVDLSAISHEATQHLRQHWERAQLDWFEEASATLDNWLYGVTAYQRLQELTDAARQRFAQSLGGDASQWLEVVLFEACLAASATDNVGQTRDIWRYRLAHLPDQSNFWKKAREFGAFFQHLEISNAEPRLNQLLDKIHHFAPLLEDVAIARQETFSNLTFANNNILEFVVTHLIYYRILFNPRQAIAELKIRMLPLLKGDIDSVDLHHIFQIARNDIQISPISQNLKDSFKSICEQLPHLTTATHLSLNYNNLAQFAAEQVRTECPDYLEEIGKIGTELCVSDNAFLLQRASMVLATALEPKETLRWWWDASVGIYLVHRERPALAANLAGFLRGFQQYLSPPDAQIISKLISELYQEALGVSTDYRGRENIAFQSLPIHHFTAQSIFNQPIEKVPDFFKSFSITKDEEAAWMNIMPSLQRDLKEKSLIELEKLWQSSSDVSLFWQGVAGRAPTYLRQISLGLKLLENTEVLSEKISGHLTRILKLSDIHQNKCRRDIGLLISYLGDCLRTQSPTLAALNVGRYWIQTISPFVRYKSAVWRLTWGRLEDEALPFLNPLEQRALHVWCAQLIAAAEFLPLTHEFCAHIFHSDDPLFAEDWTTEQQWRDLIGGMLAAAITPDCAPISGQALAQRLTLASPLFAQLSAADWQHQQTAFLSAFKHLLPSELLQKLIQRQTEITNSLIKFPICQNLQPIDSFSILLSHLDYAADRCRQAANLENLDDWLPFSLNHWHTPYFITLSEIVDGDFLKKLVCYETMSPAQIRRFLFENIDNVPDLIALNRSIGRQFGENHRLTERCQLAAQNFPMVTAAVKLLNPQKNWAEILSQKLNVASCEDLKFLMRRIALHFSGLVQCRNFAQWFWRSVGQYLSVPTRQHAEQFLPKIPTLLSGEFSTPEIQVISNIFNELSVLFKQPHWQGTPILQDFLLGSANATFEKKIPIIQALNLEEGLWSKVFIQRSPPLFYTALENALPQLLQGLNPDWRGGLNAFLRELYQHGDEEAAWQAMQPFVRQLLAQHQSDQLLTSWRHLILRTSQHLPPAPAACWTLILWRGFDIIRQTALGLKMLQHADLIAENMLLDFPVLNHQAQNDGLTDTAKCRRDLRLFIEFAGKILSSQPPSLVALNTGRFLVQYVAPFVRYTAETWRLVKLRLQEKTITYLDKNESFALYRWIGQLSGVFEQLSCLSGGVGLTLFYQENQQDNSNYYNLLSGVLVAAMTTDQAPLSGAALLQRLALSTDEKNHQNQWQSVFETLRGELLEKTLETHSRLQTYLSKIAILQKEADLRGFDVFCAIFANYPYTREIWQYEIWSRMQDGWLTAAQPADRVVSQLTGWRSPSLEKLSRLNEWLQQSIAIPTTLKTQQRQWFKNNGSAISLTPQQQQMTGFILKLLILRSTFDVNIETIKNDVSELLSWGLENETILQAIHYQSQSQTWLEKRGQLLLQQWISSQAGLKLLQNPQRLGEEAAVSFKIPQCGKDIGHLLRQIGLQLTNLQQVKLDQWYFNHIGIFLQLQTRQVAEKSMPNLLQTLKKYFTEQEWQLIELQLKNCYQAFNYLEWTDVTFSNWTLS